MFQMSVTAHINNAHDHTHSRPTHTCLAAFRAKTPSPLVVTASESAEERILLRQLQEHGVIKEFVDGHILGHALAPPRLDHELTRQLLLRSRLQGPQLHRSVQRVTRDNL